MGDFLGKVKLLFQKDKHLHNDLYKILGFFPRNIELYQIALSHSSNTYNRKDGRKFNNERLEFLGDAVLSAVVSDILYHHFENKREGFLTNTRSKIVQRNTLNELSAEMGVDKLIRSKTKKMSHNSYIAGNAFEALIGAIYLDRGFTACKAFVERQILKKFVNVDIVANTEVNFKSKLLEYCQKNRFRCEFTLKNVDNTDGNTPVFRTIVKIEEVMSGEGKGYSKKESEQEASKDALTRLTRNDKLKHQIFDAKEQRTAMEAPEYAAVPKIFEIENSLSKEAKEQQKPQNQKVQNEKKVPNDNSNSKTNQQKPTDKTPDVSIKEDTKKKKDRKDKKEQKTAEEKETQNLQKPLREQIANNKSETKQPEVSQEEKQTILTEKTAVVPDQVIVPIESTYLSVKTEPVVATEDTSSENKENKEETSAKKSGKKTNRRATKKEAPRSEQIINTEEGIKSLEAVEENPKEKTELVEKTAKKVSARQTTKKAATKKTATKKTTKEPAPVKDEASKVKEVIEVAETARAEISETVKEEKTKLPARNRSTTKKATVNSKVKKTADKAEDTPAEQKEDKSVAKKTKSTRKSTAQKKTAEKKTAEKKTAEKKTSGKKTATKKTATTKEKSIEEQPAEESKEVK